MPVHDRGRLAGGDGGIVDHAQQAAGGGIVDGNPV
jgi:hypothetical protein